MTVTLALFDYIPVILFAITGVTIMRDLYNKLSKGAFALISAGVIMVLVAGVYKATWKLFYCLGVADFYLLNNAFLPIQAAGFLLLGIGMIAGTFFPQGKNKMYALIAAPAAVPAQNRGAVFFITFMVLGYLGFCGGLVRLAQKMKKVPAVVLFVLSFVLLMGMGYLGSREGSHLDPAANWLEEGVNTAAQLCLLSGVTILHKAGLAQRESI